MSHGIKGSNLLGRRVCAKAGWVTVYENECKVVSFPCTHREKTSWPLSGLFANFYRGLPVSIFEMKIKMFLTGTYPRSKNFDWSTGQPVDSITRANRRKSCQKSKR